MLISFIILYENSKKSTQEFMFKRSIDVSKTILRECKGGVVTEDLIEHLKKMDFTMFVDKKEQEELLNHKNIKLLLEKHKRYSMIELLKLEGKYYAHIQTPRLDVLVKDNIEVPDNKTSLIIVAFLVVFLFILLYILTLKKLLKINVLKDKVKHLANENFDIDCATEHQDEISQLSNEFHKTANKLKLLKESRDIFIRNIMHELKTPIIKGKFLNQLEDTEENKHKMEKVFYRLESLINEFATIEQLISSRKAIEKKSYFLEDIVDDAIDILMCEEDEVTVNITDIKVDVDFKLFSIAIKNLIDNGIKHSINKKVTIETIDSQIVFKNEGKQLRYPLEKYFEPFFKGDDVKSNQSFGLGLYIIKNILDANDFELKYQYSEGINSFIIIKKSSKNLC
jgi:two-component system OmpR family sensor kinase